MLRRQKLRQALPKTWRRLAASEKHTRRVDNNMRARVAATPQMDAVSSAKVAGLRYVNDETTPGIRRLGGADRFRYVGPNGRTVGRVDLQRIRSLAIPPAWTDVWICPDPLG